MKRFFDMIICTCLLIVLSPILLIVGILIKVDSKGSILFKQRRIGKDNREFSIYKFRTMKIDTPNVATDKLKNPQQFITRVGKVLRKSSLDELPQLMNILKGEMSFIGPRPALYNQYELIELRTSLGVHTLVPGVTGWAQINGRDHNDDIQKSQLDKYYLDNKSLGLDMKIFFMTFFKVFRAEGIVDGVCSSKVEKTQKQSISG